MRTQLVGHLHTQPVLITIAQSPLLLEYVLSMKPCQSIRVLPCESSAPGTSWNDIITSGLTCSRECRRRILCGSSALDLHTKTSILQDLLRYKHNPRSCNIINDLLRFQDVGPILKAVKTYVRAPFVLSPPFPVFPNNMFRPRFSLCV